MADLKNYIPEIIESLKKIDPIKVILFGSVAKDNQTEYSDLDIVVIIDIEGLPRNFEDRLANKILVRNAILDLSFEVPIDLLVYTIKEFSLLQENNKPFASEINNGKVLYEKAG